MVPHNTVISPDNEKNVIKVATKNHKDKLYFKRESIDTANKIEGKRSKREDRNPDRWNNTQKKQNFDGSAQYSHSTDGTT